MVMLPLTVSATMSPWSSAASMSSLTVLSSIRPLAPVTMMRPWIEVSFTVSAPPSTVMSPSMVSTSIGARVPFTFTVAYIPSRLKAIQVGTVSS